MPDIAQLQIPPLFAGGNNQVPVFVCCDFFFGHIRLFDKQILMNPVHGALIPAVGVGRAAEGGDVSKVGGKQLLGNLRRAKVLEVKVFEEAHPEVGDLVH